MLETSIATKSVFNKLVLVSVLCQSTFLNNRKVFETVRSSQFFPKLLQLFFENPASNILHNLINKTIEHVFSDEKLIYEDYKEHLFCEVDIIQLTIPKIHNETLASMRDKHWFGHLVRIIKNYSKIQTQSTNIFGVIEREKELWTKAVGGIIKDYTEATQKELGTYEIEDQKPIEYKVVEVSVSSNHSKVMVNMNIDDEGKLMKTLAISHPVGGGRPSFEEQGDNIFQLPTDIHPPEEKEQKIE